MGRVFIILLFTASFGLAVWVFVNRESKPLQEKLVRDTGGQSLLIENFSAYRYKQHQQTGMLRAKSGKFVEPNTLEISGKVYGERVYNDKVESIASEQAFAYFDTDSLSNLVSGATLVRAELKQDVVVRYQDHVLNSQYAEYFASRESIVSAEPVKITGPKRWMTGSDGFQLELTRENIEVFGEVKGVFTPDEQKK